jgi:oxygen-independent coproporphyrinogen III oxidase
MTAGIYVHLPFCPYICPYCDFAKWRVREEPAARYLAALSREIAASPALPGATAFLGGGTPNAYPADDVAQLVGALRERFALPAGAEISVEMNPDVALSAGLDLYRAAGVTRLSIGAQSFEPTELRELGRRHAPGDVARLVRAARTAGFDNVSIDLMFGVPAQTVESWRRSLGHAIDLGVEHISTYGLTIEPDTPYARRYARDPGAFADEDLSADLYTLAMDVLTSAGYEQYEISNFARPGFRCAHNANYWANGDYLGLGVGAASYLGGERRTNTRALDAYIAAATEGRAIPAESERLVGIARAGEAAMLALRTDQGVDVRAFAERYAVDFLQMFGSVIAEMRSAGLLTASDTHVALTRRGRLLANEACAAFIASPGTEAL